MQFENDFESSLIRLGPIGEEEIKNNYINWVNEPEVNKYLETRLCSHTIESLTEYVYSINNDPLSYLLGIYLKETGEYVGNIKLGPIDKFHKRSYIGLMIGDKNVWGKGIGTESIRVISNYAFNSLKLRKISAGCYVENIASIKSFKKAGFDIEASLKSHWNYDGRWIDGVILSKFRDV